MLFVCYDSERPPPDAAGADNIVTGSKNAIF